MRIKLVYPTMHDEAKLHKIREKLWDNPGVIDEFIRSKNRLSPEEIQIVQSWETHHIKGQFVLMKYEPEYAVLMRIDKGHDVKLYAVKGMTNAIAQTMQRQLPVMLDTVLLPFRDKIIYDSFLASHSIGFGDGIREMFAEECAKSKSKYGIITKITAAPC